MILADIVILLGRNSLWRNFAFLLTFHPPPVSPCLPYKAQTLAWTCAAIACPSTLNGIWFHTTMELKQRIQNCAEIFKETVITSLKYQSNQRDWCFEIADNRRQGGWGGCYDDYWKRRRGSTLQPPDFGWHNMYLEMFLARYGLVLESKVISQNQGQKFFQKKSFLSRWKWSSGFEAELCVVRKSKCGCSRLIR